LRQVLNTINQNFERKKTMIKSIILVTGATGKTGGPVVRQLLERGYPVRAFVRKIDDRSQRLAELGAEVVVGDFHDLESVRSAMRGVARAYFCYPPHAGLLRAATNVAIAARDEGVESVVNMSQISAREEAKSPLSHTHWVTEQVFEWADIGASHIHPGFFAEDLYLFTAGSIPREGKINLPFGDGKHAPVSATDIARVVVGILIDPQPHVGKHYIVTGPTDMTLSEMADVFSTELGKPVEYVNIPVEAWKNALDENPLMPSYLATHLAAVAVDHQNGIFSAETNVVETIGGQPPESLTDFVRRNIDVFGEPVAAKT
jgi:NAD(P)H dehydrogenase (quinone)